MVGFEKPVRVEVVPPWLKGYNGKASLLTVVPLRYRSKSGVTFKVPKGFASDGASVPRLLRWAVPRFAKTLYAALLHDYLIRFSAVSDRTADKLFYEALRLSKVKMAAAVPMYLAVRIGSIFRCVQRKLGMWKPQLDLVEPEDR